LFDLLRPVSHGNGFNESHRSGKLLAYGLIINPGINQGFVDILMAQEFLQGGDGHALIDEQSR
jgi:hypothetical protein